MGSDTSCACPRRCDPPTCKELVAYSTHALGHYPIRGFSPALAAAGAAAAVDTLAVYYER